MADEKSDEPSKDESKKVPKKTAELEKQLEEARQKADEYLDMARRVQADFENYRRRTEREAEDRRKYATLDLVKELLNTVDDLGRALENADPEDPLTVGVKGVRDNLVKIMEAQGVKEIPSEGRFDPEFHEALATVEADEDGMVAMTAQKGYTMHDRVIRYAKVIVTKKKEQPAPAPEEGPADNAQEIENKEQ